MKRSGLLIGPTGNGVGRNKPQLRRRKLMRKTIIAVMACCSWLPSGRRCSAVERRYTPTRATKLVPGAPPLHSLSVPSMIPSIQV